MESCILALHLYYAHREDTVTMGAAIQNSLFLHDNNNILPRGKLHCCYLYTFIVNSIRWYLCNTVMGILIMCSCLCQKMKAWEFCPDLPSMLVKVVFSIALNTVCKATWTTVKIPRNGYKAGYTVLMGNKVGFWEDVCHPYGLSSSCIPHCTGIKKYIVGLIIKLSSTPESLEVKCTVDVMWY